MLYPMMQLPIFFHRFICVLDWFWNARSCVISNVLELIVGFDIRNAFWLRHSTRLRSSRALIASRKATWEEDDWRTWIEYYVFFISEFFMCNSEMYCVESCNPPSLRKKNVSPKLVHDLEVVN
jgi:hypothetical protein